MHIIVYSVEQLHHDLLLSPPVEVEAFAPHGITQIVVKSAHSSNFPVILKVRVVTMCRTTLSSTVCLSAHWLSEIQLQTL